MSDEDASRAQLAALIHGLREQMLTEAPPALRQEQERALDYAEQLLRATSDEERRLEAKHVLPNVPRPLQGTAELTAASAHVHVVSDVEPWQVWVRWDDVPKDLREPVIVLATFWRDIIVGRPLGRPRKSPER